MYNFTLYYVLKTSWAVDKNTVWSMEDHLQVGRHLRSENVKLYHLTTNQTNYLSLYSIREHKTSSTFVLITEHSGLIREQINKIVL